MSLNATLNLSTQGLEAQKSSLHVIGHNIANVNTEGYSRQIATMESKGGSSQKGYGQIGLGVSVVSVTRSLNAHINTELTNETNNYNNWNEKLLAMNRVEGIVNESPTTGLSAMVNDYFNAWQDVTNDPESMGARTALLVKGENMANFVNRLDSNLDQVKRDLDSSVEATVTQINNYTSQIATLNTQIQNVEATGQNANDLRDRRYSVVNKLSALVDIQTYEQTNKQLFVQTKNGGVSLVAGAGSLNLEVRANGNNSSFNDIMWNDGKNNLTDVTSRIGGGTLEAYINVRDTVIPQYQETIDRFSGSLVNAVNLQHQQGFGLGASSGFNFFDPLLGGATANRANTGNAIATVSVSDASTLTRDNYTIQFTSATTFSVTNRTNSTVEGTFVAGSAAATTFFNSVGLNVAFTGTAAVGDSFIAGGTVNMGRDIAVNQQLINDPTKIAASADGQRGNNANAQAIVGLQSSGQMDNFSPARGSGAFTFTEFYSSFIAQVGSDTANVRINFNHSDNMLTEMKNQRESTSGVSLDQEMADLIRFQQAFAGQAKVISTVNQMMQEVIQIL
ncbi:MAG: flagellar hook-associated protein FlgK [Nitrospinae bacterium]|nr:flagellar hook-associated protein FlgK [Nitrospinota bacterium]